MHFHCICIYKRGKQDVIWLGRVFFSLECISWHIWKHTVEKSWTNATNVTIDASSQANDFVQCIHFIYRRGKQEVIWSGRAFSLDCWQFWQFFLKILKTKITIWTMAKTVIVREGGEENRKQLDWEGYFPFIVYWLGTLFKTSGPNCWSIFLSNIS